MVIGALGKLSSDGRLRTYTRIIELFIVRFPYNYILMVTWLLIKNNYEPMIMQLPNCTINGLIGDLTLEHGDFMGFTMWIS